MNLYLLEQDVNKDWEVYFACVVAANTEEEARIKSLELGSTPRRENDSWIGQHDISAIEVTQIGIADAQYTEPTIILAANYGA